MLQGDVHFYDSRRRGRGWELFKNKSRKQTIQQNYTIYNKRFQDTKKNDYKLLYIIYIYIYIYYYHKQQLQRWQRRMKVDDGICYVAVMKCRWRSSSRKRLQFFFVIHSNMNIIVQSTSIQMVPSMVVFLLPIALLVTVYLTITIA
jgi:hypothetical protein